jgi:hypothetical protein
MHHFYSFSALVWGQAWNKEFLKKAMLYDDVIEIGCTLSPLPATLRVMANLLSIS